MADKMPEAELLSLPAGHVILRSDLADDGLIKPGFQVLIRGYPADFADTEGLNSSVCHPAGAGYEDFQIRVKVY